MNTNAAHFEQFITLIGYSKLYSGTDGTMQWFARGNITSMVQETRFAMTLPPTLSGIMVACGVLFSIPKTNVLGAIFVTGLLGRRRLCLVRSGAGGVLSGPVDIGRVLRLNREPACGCLLPMSRVAVRNVADPPICPVPSGRWSDCCGVRLVQTAILPPSMREIVIA